MEKSNILSADILDILFDGRNKSYGAYDLRKTYDKRIAYSLAGTFFLCLCFAVSSIMANGKKNSLRADIGTEVSLVDYVEPEKELPPPVKKEIQKVEMKIFTEPKIEIDSKVKPEDQVEDMAVLDDVKIGPVNQKGINDGDVVSPPVESTSTAGTERKQDETETTFTTVQMVAEFPGGVNGWRKYLERNLNKDLPIDNGAPAGSYTVTVSFIVDVNGAISDVKAENDPGYGTKAEAIRVIQKGPNWKPAEQNGRKVIYRHKQNITFQVAQE